MEIVYFSEGNFGDDLNRIIWPEILSARLRDEPDLALLGIGSLINDSFVAPIMRSGRRLIILGSGAEYGRLPSCMGEVEVLAVRGPLTAEVIGRPSSAITDGAILLADTSHGKPGTRTKDVVFMPHFQTSKDSRWRDASRMASLTYLDPRDDVIKTLDALRSARLVISEAMHGAIVADVLRVPWIPLQISPLTSAFKWVDWASSLSVPYEPRMLEPASVWEMQRYRRLSRQQRAMDLPLPNMVGNQQRLVSEFRRRYTRPDGLSKGPSAFEQWRRRGRSVAARMLALGQRGGDGPYLDAAAKRLQQLAREAGYLSEDRIFGTRLDQMREAVRVLEQRVR